MLSNCLSRMQMANHLVPLGAKRKGEPLGRGLRKLGTALRKLGTAPTFSPGSYHRRTFRLLCAALAVFLVSTNVGCASGTRLLLILDPPYKGKYELIPDPSKKYVPGSLIRIRPVAGVAYVPDGFIKSTVTPGGGVGGSVEQWSLEGIQDPSGKLIAGPSAIDHTRISIRTDSSSGKAVQFILQVD